MAFWEARTGSYSALLRLTVNVVSQNIAANTSTLYAELLIHNVGSSTFNNGSIGASISGIGATVGGSFNWPSGTNSKVVLSFTRTLSHNSDGTLYLAVSGAIGATGTSGIGGPTGLGAYGFTLPTIPRQPSAPTLSSSNPSQLYASWNAQTGATGYVVQIATASDFTGATTYTRNGVSPSYNFTGLLPGRTYYVRAASQAAAGTSAYSVGSSLAIGIGGKRWTGTAEVPFTEAFRWDGTQEVPLTVAVRWDGTAEVPISS